MNKKYIAWILLSLQSLLYCAGTQDAGLGDDGRRYNLNFYGKLEMMSDDDLKKGNFSREEIKQRLNELGNKPD